MRRWMIPWTGLMIGWLGFALAASAQPPAPVAGFPHAGGPWRDMAPERFQIVSDFLELDREQSIRWRGVRDTYRDRMAEALEAIAELRQELRQRLEEPEPDLAGLGALAVEIHRKVEGLRADREAMESELRGLLTADQAVRFDALLAAREIEHAAQPPFPKPPSRGRF